MQALNERLGFLAHELRNLIQTATLAVTAIKAGNVGLAGATGAVLDRSLIGLRNLIDRSLADVRIMAGMPARRALIPLPDFIGEVQISAALEARARGCRLNVSAAGLGLAVDGDREMLAAAVGNLLQNAFKFTRPRHRGLAQRLLERRSGPDRGRRPLRRPCRQAMRSGCSSRSRKARPTNRAWASGSPSAAAASRPITGFCAYATCPAPAASSPSTFRDTPSERKKTKGALGQGALPCSTSANMSTASGAL